MQRLMLYKFLSGSSVPSGFVLWVMREMPPSLVVDSHRISESTIVTFIRETNTVAGSLQWRDTVTSSQNKVWSESLNLICCFLSLAVDKDL